ncbi:MAG: hypothetical protein M3T96_08030 [Acidobacteriota bacterium]|nr:hypothetical protein [Acidobacteriota bacterium]
MFDENDFYRISKFIRYFDLKITTPHILTEVSDLLGNRKYFQLVLKTYIETSKENFSESVKVCVNKSFLSFGLADTAIIETAKDSYLVVTNDNRLFGYLVNENIDAVNLDQIRMI